MQKYFMERINNCTVQNKQKKNGSRMTPGYTKHNTKANLFPTSTNGPLWKAASVTEFLLARIKLLTILV